MTGSELCVGHSLPFQSGLHSLLTPGAGHATRLVSFFGHSGVDTAAKVDRSLATSNSNSGRVLSDGFFVVSASQATLAARDLASITLSAPGCSWS